MPIDPLARAVTAGAARRCALALLGLLSLGHAAASLAAAPGDNVLVSRAPQTGRPLPYAALGTQGAHHSVSADGRYVTFQAYQGGWHIFVRDTVLDRTERVSVSSTGEPANYDSEDPAISDDGRYVVFESGATNLAPGDRGWGGIFLRDRVAGTTERIDVNAAGGSANHYSYAPVVSGDGRFVVFVSYATNLVANDANGHLSDVFVRDRAHGLTQLVSVATNGTSADGTATQPAISPDGRYVVFVSDAPNLVPSGASPGVSGGFHVYLRDRVAQVTELESPRASGTGSNEAWPCLSADGRYVAFTSSARDFVQHDTNRDTDIFVRDRDRDVIKRVSVSGIEAQANGYSDFAAISADGRYIAFQSDASNLVPRDTNDTTDIFVRDQERGLTKRVSVTPDGAQSGGRLVSISADGQYVAFDATPPALPAAGVYLQQVSDDGWNNYGMTLQPRELDFGKVPVGTAVTQTVWVRNKGTLPLPIRSIDLGGPAAQEFTYRSECGAQVAVDAKCAVQVTFRPASRGDKTANLQVVASDYLQRTASLAGTGS